LGIGTWFDGRPVRSRRSIIAETGRPHDIMRPVAKRTQVPDNAGMGEARYQNVHGRRWGRGARPYLLMAKIVFVAVFVGGLISLLTLVLISPLPATDEGRHIFADALHRAYAWLIVPSLAGAMIMGVALSASFWRAAVRMRWLQVKALLIVVCVPMLHVFMRKRSLTLQSLARADGTDTQVLANLRDEILIGTAAVLVFAVLVVLLGRLKPRLGQRYGRARTAGQA